MSDPRPTSRKPVADPSQKPGARVGVTTSKPDAPAHGSDLTQTRARLQGCRVPKATIGPVASSKTRHSKSAEIVPVRLRPGALPADAPSCPATKALEA
jgi:hypothetical protein